MSTNQFIRCKTICEKVVRCRICMFLSIFFDGFYAITKDLQKCSYGNHFVTILKCSVNVFKPDFRGWRAIWPRLSKNHVIPSQCAHWRGNPLDFQTFLIIIDGFSLELKEIATPACGLVRNDILILRLFLLAEAIWPAFSPGALTRKGNCVTVYVVKSFDERHALFVRISERNPFGARVPVPCGQRHHFPSCGAEMPRRSRPLPRQWVTASCRNQGGTVEYFVSHPWFCSGDGTFFIPSPNQKGGNNNVWSKSVHLWEPRVP